MTGKHGLSARQRRFVEALAQGKTATEAAQVAGVSERTGRRYSGSPVVRAALAEAQDRALGDVVRRMNSGAGDALDVLAEIMQDKAQSGGVRIRAAQVWLEQAFKSRELLDMAREIAELREVVHECTKRDKQAT